MMQYSLFLYISVVVLYAFIDISTPKSIEVIRNLSISHSFRYIHKWIPVSVVFISNFGYFQL